MSRRRRSPGNCIVCGAAQCSCKGEAGNVSVPVSETMRRRLAAEAAAAAKRAAVAQQPPEPRVFTTSSYKRSDKKSRRPG